MVTLDVCVEAVFPDWPVEDRVRAAAECGYEAVEFWLHDATFNGADLDTSQPKNAASLRATCDAAGVAISNMVVNPPDDGTFGGTPTDASTHDRFLKRVSEVIEFARQAGCSRAIVCSGDHNPAVARDTERRALEDALGKAAAVAAARDFVLLLEPLNVHVDHAGYFLDSSGEAAELVRAVGSPHLRLLYDIYHMQVMEGNLLAHIESYMDVIGHFHSAGVPGRAEHFNGELDYPAILDRIEKMGYSGYFGLEYFPAMDDHAASLREVREYLSGGK